MNVKRFPTFAKVSLFSAAAVTLAYGAAFAAFLTTGRTVDPAHALVQTSLQAVGVGLLSGLIVLIVKKFW